MPTVLVNRIVNRPASFMLRQTSKPRLQPRSQQLHRNTYGASSILYPNHPALALHAQRALRPIQLNGECDRFTGLHRTLRLEADSAYAEVSGQTQAIVRQIHREADRLTDFASLLALLIKGT